MEMKGEFKPLRVVQQVDLKKWSEKVVVKMTWHLPAAEWHGLEEDAFEKATWPFLGFVLGRDFNMVMRMSKARKLGWTGYQDTCEAFEESFRELADRKILPAFD